MLITQAIQDSFQEYRDQWSLVLFSFGCNFSCKYCYNLDFSRDRKNIIGEAKDLIKQYLHPGHEAVVFLGGEPTIWKDALIETTKQIKDMGLKVKIFTNGFLSEVIKKLNDQKLVDAYSVDLKTIKEASYFLGVAMNDDEYLWKFRSTINHILDAGIFLEVRTTKWPGINIEEIKDYMKQNLPAIPHIIQDDFSKNLKHI